MTDEMTDGTEEIAFQPDLLKAKPDDPFPVPSVSESFQRAPELEALAEDLLKRDDQLIDDLRWEIGWGAAEGARVRFVWKQKGGTSYGSATLARCVKLGGLTKHYGRGDFAVWLAADHLADREPTYEEVRAILFHELCHIRKVVSEDDEITYQLRPHDIEAFESEIMLFGNTVQRIREVAPLFQQVKLPDV